ncbi:ABC transporter ATP-binding protein [Microbacterium sp.]|uniref:ABC transporter ATP-binding protein n=1 Tax=Microbacterium sp. TaxID=51671 RepID=UPI002810CC18|nr:ATP-binding cassette domain-containing protein [Microbacterium sp.]
MMAEADRVPAIRVAGVDKTFVQGDWRSRRRVHALRAVDLEVGRAEIVALVGESGSGKSTLARCIARLERPDSGVLEVLGEDVLRTQPRRASKAYRRTVQMVFQDPFGSLNPTQRVEHVLARPLLLHGKVRGDIRTRLEELVTSVGLPPDVLGSFPHELSGGQRQRIAIARVLAVEPEIIIADEPTSMLDVSVRIGVLNLLARLRDERGIAILYVTHDLASARYLADRIVVMHQGTLVEGGESMALLAEPRHPYTRMLVGAVPDPDRRGGYDAGERARQRTEIWDWAESDSARVYVDEGAGHWVWAPKDRRVS